MTKAKLTIEPGCEAGSLYCQLCSKADLAWLKCTEFELALEYDESRDLYKRSKACLDAEVTDD